MLIIRSLICLFGVIPLTLFFGLFSLLILTLPFQVRYKIISQWAKCNLWWTKIVCGLSFRVHGEENIPPGPAVIMCNHQSAWETLALQLIFPAQVWVLKKELLWIPIFGWGLSALNPIAIDRGSARKALQQVVEQGTDRLKNGIWVTIFPEGTRIAPGETRRYGKSGGLLASKIACPVVPVAHNAGLFWPKNSILRKPGVIDIVIGPVIASDNKSVNEITQEVQNWIDPMAKQLVDESLDA
ncbi:MAG: lysophospholipid acyltransferase family protein [Gammaproteobacteria bacterium]